MKQIHIKLPELLHRELKIQATIKGQIIQNYAVKAMKNQLAIEKDSDTPLTTDKESNDDSISTK